MFSLDLEKLTPEQRAMVELWEEHLKAEFQDKDARVLRHDGRASLREPCAGPDRRRRPSATGAFLWPYFIPSMPPDVELVPISRTVGQDRLVDEFVFRCTHTVQMDWLLPGVPPTGGRWNL